MMEGGEFILGHIASHGLFRDVARVRSCNAMSGERKIVEMNISIRVLNREKALVEPSGSTLKACVQSEQK